MLHIESLNPKGARNINLVGNGTMISTFKNVAAIKQLKQTAYNSALRSRKDMRFFSSERYAF